MADMIKVKYRTGTDLASSEWFDVATTYLSADTKWLAEALRSAAMDLGTSSAALLLAARANQIERQ